MLVHFCLFPPPPFYTIILTFFLLYPQTHPHSSQLAYAYVDLLPSIILTQWGGYLEFSYMYMSPSHTSSSFPTHHQINSWLTPT